MIFRPGYIDAIGSLRPNHSWSLAPGGEVVSSDPTFISPSKEEIKLEMLRLQHAYDTTEYQRLRAQEYPPVTDYLDAVVKGDLVQQQAYIDACLAVKAKYPKPEGV